MVPTPNAKSRIAVPVHGRTVQAARTKATPLIRNALEVGGEILPAFELLSRNQPCSDAQSTPRSTRKTCSASTDVVSAMSIPPRISRARTNWLDPNDRVNNALPLTKKQTAVLNTIGVNCGHTRTTGAACIPHPIITTPPRSTSSPPLTEDSDGRI